MKNLFLNHNKKKGILESFAAWFMAFSLVMQGMAGLPFVAYANDGENSISVVAESSSTSVSSSNSSWNSSESYAEAQASAVVNNSSWSSSETSAEAGTQTSVVVDNSSNNASASSSASSSAQASVGTQGNTGWTSGNIEILKTFAQSMNSGSNDPDDDNDDNDDKHHKKHKITICHIPPGNPGNAHEIEVDEHSVTFQAHLSHGDYVGHCDHTPPPSVNTPPVITLLGANPLSVTQGSTFTDPGATVLDTEDGDITDKLVTTGTVNTSVVGTYTITYNATDSQNLAAAPKARTVKVVAQSGCTVNCGGSSNGSITIVASKIVCDAESKLPNWGMGGPDITSTTATDYVASHPGCVLTPDWKFQWGYQGVADAGATLVGEAPHTGSGATDWKTFGPTNASGVASVSVSNVDHSSVIWVREVLKSGYIPFTFDTNHQQNDNNVSAEMYCHTDVLNYDNYDYVNVPEAGHTYYCVAFNALKNPTPGNTPPVITLLGANPLSVTQGSTFTDPGATVFDAEDGPINNKLATTSTVNTAVVGTYTITYNATDSQNLAATPKTRTVNVVPAGGCTVNCGGGATNTPPVITLLGADPLIVSLNSTFTDPGANATDIEDCASKTQAQCNTALALSATGTVNTAVVGTYTITYTAVDSGGLHAIPKTRTVKVVTACSDGIDNDGDGLVDFPLDPGCDSATDNNENNPPVITLLGASPLSVTQGSPFTDPGANASDTEDCIGKTQAQCNTALNLTASGTVNTAVVGTYTITYTAVDSGGLHAIPKTRIVNVVAGPGCTVNCGGGTTNTPPTITLIGANPLVIHIGGVFTDPGANASDTEDCIGQTQGQCNTTVHLTASGTVNTAVAGSYTITYTAVDSQNLAATPVSRTVKVESACSDGVDNDGDGKVDFPNDPGCKTPNDDSENDRPVITLIGDVVMQLVVGSTFTEPGANATDTEDCVGKTQSECNTALHLTATGTVNSSVVGTYTITYNATDSQNLAATPVSRTVNVVPAGTPGCTTNCGGGSGTFDYWGCTDPTATNYNRLANKDDGSCVHGEVLGTSTPPGGGGGGGSSQLYISNEKLAVTGTTSVTVTWNTNLPADSRVVYGLNSVNTLTAPPYYGYQLTTGTDTTQVYNHSIVINGIPSAIATYFRPVSSASGMTATGIELSRTPATSVGGSCEYLKEYMRMGINNNPDEVKKLQLFLKNFEGQSSLAVTGFFDITTDQAVRAFQDKYKTDVLEPWNLPGNTGYVYYTTKKKINEIYCQRSFPLNSDQLSEIAAFRALIASINAQGGEFPTQPLVGMNNGGNAGSVAGASTVKDKPFQGVTISDVPGTKEAEGETTTRGSIALSDLMAVPSSMTGILNGSDTEGSVAGTSTTREGFMSIIKSIVMRTGLTPTQVVLILSVLLLTLASAIYALITKNKAEEINPDNLDSKK